MLVKLQNRKYIITQIIEDNKDINFYTGQNIKNRRFVINEISNIQNISDILRKCNFFANEDFDIFTENSSLYLTAPLYEGESLTSYLKYHPLSITDKIEILKEVLFLYIKNEDYPDIIRQNIFISDNICVNNRQLGFNCFLKEIGDKNPCILFADLIKTCFKAEEIQNHNYFKIFIKKLENKLYENFAQVYVDMQQLEQFIKNKKGFIQKAKDWYQSRKKIIGSVLTVFSVALVILIIFNMVSKDDKKAGLEYNNVENIGSVKITKEKDKIIHDVYID